MSQFDTVIRALLAAYTEGYRRGYANGRSDGICGVSFNETFGAAFEEWLVNGDGGRAPFPELESHGKGCPHAATDAFARVGMCPGCGRDGGHEEWCEVTS